MPVDNNGARNPMFGRTHSKETKLKMAAARKKYTGEKSSSWKGGRRINHNGYVELYQPEHHRARGNGYVFEHIVIAELKIGRTITFNENVHHIDKNRQNNLPENLEVMSASDHTKNHHTKQRQGVYKNCVICGNQFYRKKSHAERGKCCSLQCVGKYAHQLKNRSVSV